MSMYNALTVACKRGDVNVVRKLLDEPLCDPDSKAMINAINYGHIDIVEILLNDGRIHPQRIFEYQMVSSLIHDFENPMDINILQMLLKDHRVDPSEGENSALNTAFLIENVTVVNMLIKDDRVRRTIQLDRIYSYCKQREQHPMVDLIERLYHRRRMGILKASTFLVSIYYRSLRDHYAPGGVVAKELETSFYEKFQK